MSGYPDHPEFHTPPSRPMPAPTTPSVETLARALWRVRFSGDMRGFPADSDSWAHDEAQALIDSGAVTPLADAVAAERQVYEAALDQAAEEDDPVPVANIRATVTTLRGAPPSTPTKGD